MKISEKKDESQAEQQKHTEDRRQAFDHSDKKSQESCNSFNTSTHVEFIDKNIVKDLFSFSERQI